MSESDCPTCGAKTVEYKHGLSLPLVAGLVRLYRSGGGPVNLKDLGLTRNQWDNFQKLRYFGLVVQVYEDGRRRAGMWRITRMGQLFVEGTVSRPKHAWTFRGVLQRYEGEHLYIHQVGGLYKSREEWAAEALPYEMASA